MGIEGMNDLYNEEEAGIENPESVSVDTENIESPEELIDIGAEESERGGMDDIGEINLEELQTSKREAEEVFGSEMVDEYLQFSPENREAATGILVDDFSLGELIREEIENVEARRAARESVLGTAFTLAESSEEEVASEGTGSIEGEAVQGGDNIIPGAEAREVVSGSEEIVSEKFSRSFSGRVSGWLKKATAIALIGVSGLAYAGTAEAGSIFDSFTKNKNEITQTFNQARKGLRGLQELNSIKQRENNLKERYQQLELQRQTLLDKGSPSRSEATDKLSTAKMVAAEKKHEAQLARIDLQKSRAQERFDKSRGTDVDRATLDEALANLDVQIANEEARYLEDQERIQKGIYTQGNTNTEAQITRIEGQQRDILLQLNKLGIDTADVTLRTINDINRTRR